MGRHAADGFAVLAPKWIGRGYDVIGVGFDPVGAIRDANWKDNQCTVPDVRYSEHRPDWLIVKARVSISYDKQAVTEETSRVDKRNAERERSRRGE